MIWIPQALADVGANAEFIAKDSVYYAQLFTRKVFDPVEKIADFPQIGRIVTEINSENIKEIILENYRIIYRINNELVEILTVYHSARLLEIEDLFVDK